LIPTATDFDVIDKFMKVSDEESAHTTREIAKKKVYLLGILQEQFFKLLNNTHRKENLTKIVMLLLYFRITDHVI